MNRFPVRRSPHRTVLVLVRVLDRDAAVEDHQVEHQEGGDPIAGVEVHQVEHAGLAVPVLDLLLSPEVDHAGDMGVLVGEHEDAEDEVAEETGEAKEVVKDEYEHLV